MSLEIHSERPNVYAIESSPNHDLTLSESVRIAVKQYLSQVNGHPVCGLHAMVMCEVEKPLIETVLKHMNHNQTKVAKALGLSRSTLRKKMDQYGIG